MRRPPARLAPLVVAALVLALLGTGPGVSPGHAQGGEPRLRPSAKALDDSLVCTPQLRNRRGKPVLMVPGTTLNGPANFDWNYLPALRAEGRGVCLLSVPDAGMSDIQVAAEYVVHAIRTLHRATGRKVAVIGYSQGGMSPRWALKYWPSTRAMVDELIGIAPANRGVALASTLCALPCSEAIWQLARGSAFHRALNRPVQTYRGIAYTTVASRQDEVVPTASTTRGGSPLLTGRGTITNLMVQDLCPGHVSDHITMGTVDPVVYAVVLDALTHRGPAKASRIDRGVCRDLLMPGVDPATAADGLARFTAELALNLSLAERVDREPRLRRYAR